MSKDLTLEMRLFLEANQFKGGLLPALVVAYNLYGDANFVPGGSVLEVLITGGTL